MAGRDLSGDPPGAALHLAFGALIEAGEIDISTLPDTEETEVQADDWTLHLEGSPITTAWIAIDQDPVSAKEQLAALDRTFNHREREALRDADRRLAGGMLACLRASGDDLSVRLADLLQESAGGGDKDAT